MSKHNFDTHRCDGTRANRCSIRRYPASGPANRFDYEHDGRWHLFSQEYDFDWGTAYMEHVAPINVCPFCGAVLDTPNTYGKNNLRTTDNK